MTALRVASCIPDSAACGSEATGGQRSTSSARIACPEGEEHIRSRQALVGVCFGTNILQLEGVREPSGSVTTTEEPGVPVT